ERKFRRLQRAHNVVDRIRGAAADLAGVAITTQNARSYASPSGAPIQITWRHPACGRLTSRHSLADTSAPVTQLPAQLALPQAVNRAGVGVVDFEGVDVVEKTNVTQLKPGGHRAANARPGHAERASDLAHA